MLLQQYVELRDMKDVSLNYSTFSESDKDSAWEIMSPLLDMVQKNVGTRVLYIGS